MSQKETIRRILREEIKIPLSIRRRVDFDVIDKEFNRVLDMVSETLVQKKSKLISMTAEKFGILETIKAKVINIDTLPKKIRKVFSHLGNKEEMTEGEITERCWKGYTQKGMKTMFGKRYPNCVKKTKK